MGVLATWKVRRAVRIPLLGIGGVSTAEDALQYLIAGASLVGMGTAMLRDPRAPERVVRDLARWCETHNVREIAEIIGSLDSEMTGYARPIVALDLSVPGEALSLARRLREDLSLL